MLPYLNYCVEVWGNTYQNSLQSLFILQKRAIRIIHNTGYLEHTNSLFLQSKVLKLIDLVEFQTAVFMFKARNNLLPGIIQKMFFEREGGYNLRGMSNFKTTRKSFCLSVSGVKLWNKLNYELKQCTNISQFKRMCKEIIFQRYKET